jgi:hypothetical protein
MGWCGLTMFTKEVSRPVESLDPPIVATEAEQVERTREGPGHGPDPRFLCPIRRTNAPGS